MLPLPWHNLDFYYRKFVCPFKNDRFLDDLSFQLSDLTNYGIEFGIELNDQSKILDHAQAFKFTEQKQNESNVDEQRLDRQLQSNLRRSNRLIYALKFALKMKFSIILGIMCVPFARRIWQMKIKFEFFSFLLFLEKNCLEMIICRLLPHCLIPSMARFACVFVLISKSFHQGLSFLRHSGEFDCWQRRWRSEFVFWRTHSWFPFIIFN